jgi:hypothetical protein
MRRGWPGPQDKTAFALLPPDPPPLAERWLGEKAAASRLERGLPVDSGFLERAIENSSRADYRWPGLFFTPEEEADLAAFDSRLADCVEAVLKEAGAEIGGLRLAWRGGRRAIEVTVKEDEDHFRRVVRRELASDRIFVRRARYSGRELRAVCDRIGDERGALEDLGIEVVGWGPTGDDAVVVEYFAADSAKAEEMLVSRFGGMVRPDWFGLSRITEEPQRFASWVAEGTELTVFYVRAHDESPGRCEAEEFDDRVVVSLTVLVPNGPTIAVGGGRRCHATVNLTRPVGDRLVVDAAENVARPEWRGDEPS